MSEMLKGTHKKIILGAFADEAGSSVAEQIAAMVDNDIQNLEARNIEGKNFVELSIAEAKELKARLDAHGLRVWSIGSPFGKIGIQDAMEPHLDKLKHTLELAEVMGSERIRVFSFFIPEGEDATIYRDEVMGRLSRMVETTAGSNVMLCHENEKGIYGDTAIRCAEILANFPQMGGVFDPANFIQCGQDTLVAWDMLRERIDYFHIKDCLADGQVVPCGRGVGHIPEMLSDFIARGGSRLTLEPHLTVFEGFAQLEQDSAKTKMDRYSYPSQRVSFDVAVKALKEYL